MSAEVSRPPTRPLPRWTFWARATTLVLARPRLWAAALRQALRLARPGWWRRPPFLPVPDPAYLRFRFETQYGDDARPDPRDLVAYLEWCHAMDHPPHPVGTRR
jgi:hypothetical protein